MDSPEHIMVMTTHETQEAAEAIARTLVEEQLVACAQLLPISSYFTWEGKVDHASEVLILLKTRSVLYDGLEARIRELHSYDVPEILTVPIVSGLNAYKAWMDDVTLAS